MVDTEEPTAPDSPDERPPARAPLAPDLRVGEVRRGARPGTRYVRVTRAADRTIRRTGEGRYEATLAAERPRSGIRRVLMGFRHRVLGAPLTTAQAGEERLNKKKALAIFSSDALSSSAYATEEILLALMVAGAGALAYGLPISLSIAVLLAIVIVSYRQVVRAYPRGGGAYEVARQNLGLGAGLVSASAILTDYVLTVAVSISAGTLAIISAFPELAPYRVEIAVTATGLMTLGNLRGARESGTMFALPTYLFLLAFGGMILAGLARLAFGEGAGSFTESAPPREEMAATQAVGVFLILRAFSSGATALTGVEAIADGVQAFKPPESKNAEITMAWMGVFLVTFFTGATFLAIRFGIVPVENESVISQTARLAFGGQNVFYYVLQASTALILVLAANTAFNGFPRLASILAQDDFLPRQFAFRGDRLAFSYGIIVLAGLAMLLLIGFRADTHSLIPLYAVGVFIAFTLGQSGMFLRWRRLRGSGWRRAAAINGTGALATGVVAVVVAGTKFMHGAWAVLVLMAVMAFVLQRIHRHYAFVRRELEVKPGVTPLRMNLPPNRPVIVPVGELNLASLRALAYARGLASSNVTAIHVVTDEGDDSRAFEEAWARTVPDIPLAILESPYRSFQAPFMAYIDALDDPYDDMPLTVVLPEFVPKHWYERYLHNRTALRLREALHQRPNTVVVSVTELLDRD